MLEHWLTDYDWVSEQRKLNKLPRFKVDIELEGWATFGIHFVHAPSRKGKDAIPLIYLHGWPGNFTEVKEILAPLQFAGYHVVAPSLPGFGFSSYATTRGFKNWHSAQLLHRLMICLGYQKYVVAAGDWGALVASSMARLYPEHI